MNNFDDELQAWQARSAELAQWAGRLLVNRHDAWGSYLPVEQRGDRNTARTAHGELTVEILEQHFAGADVGDLVGLHAIAPDNTCRWVAIDIDHHGDDDEELGVLNFNAATAWYDRLSELGFRPLLIDSNGRGGFHLIVLFSEPVASTVVFNFGRWLVSDWQDLHLREQPEVFPKQSELDTFRQYGNWLRLPGRHHTLPFVSRLWSGSAWLTGESAVEAILEAAGQPAEQIPVEAGEYTPPGTAAATFGIVDPDGYERPVLAVLRRLHNVSDQGSGWSACCPAHDDHDPSLSVSETEDGTVLVCCHADCTAEAIVSAIGLPMRALYPTSRTRRNGPASRIRSADFQPLADSLKRAEFGRALDHTHGEITIDLLTELAESLGVPESSLEELHVGWSAMDQAWTIPERDGHGNIIGLMRRYRVGTKRVLNGSSRGLYIPAGLGDRRGPVLVVEGASDTAAVTAMNLAAVGRPNATGGVPYLVELLADDHRDVLIVGEMDAARDGRWPGRDGAQSVAQRLAGRLRQQVGWALPPRAVKDLRSWFNREVRDAS
jgi:hypothetical protein